jgi:hypothetical protein
MLHIGYVMGVQPCSVCKWQWHDNQEEKPLTGQQMFSLRSVQFENLLRKFWKGEVLASPTFDENGELPELFVGQSGRKLKQKTHKWMELRAVQTMIRYSWISSLAWLLLTRSDSLGLVEEWTWARVRRAGGKRLRSLLDPEILQMHRILQLIS